MTLLDGMSYRELYNKLNSITLKEEEEEEGYLNSNGQSNATRIQCIKTLMKTEYNYIKKIRDLLISIYPKSSFWSTVSRNQVSLFYQHLPFIFDLHNNLRTELIQDLRSSQLIGRNLIKCLDNQNLLVIYFRYIDCVSDYLNMCNQMKLNENFIRYLGLSSLESIIMMPIQRFPQLQLVVNDIYKNTSDSHEDKINLYKSNCLLKSISMCLDKRRRFCESQEITEIVRLMKRLRIQMTSEKILSKNSVFYIKPNFTIPRKLIKIMYYLILCDKEIIMYPRDIALSDLSPNMVFCYSLEEVNFQIKNVFNFSNQKNFKKDFDRMKDLFLLIKDSFMTEKVLNEVEIILNDYHSMIKISEEVGQLHFEYDYLNPLKISKSIIKLEQKLYNKERELNNYFNFLLNLKIVKLESFEDNKIFQFDSSKQANDWKTIFFRTKLSLGLVDKCDWRPIIITNQHISENITEEFPLSLPSYILNDSGILNIESSVIKYEIITIILGIKISRCLWLIMSDGLIIILHFNDKQWNFLETIQTRYTEPINVICRFSYIDSNIADISLDKEMWIGYKNEIISYSLEYTEHSLEKLYLILPSDLNSICQIGNKMYVGLKSSQINIYTQFVRSKWTLELTISLEEYIPANIEELQNIVTRKDDILIYYVCQSTILISDKSKEIDHHIKLFKTDKKISCFCIYADGVWIAEVENLNLKMYDKNMQHLLQNLIVPISFFGSYFFNSITSILLTDKYMWIGTSSGFIIIISTIDRLACINRKVTVHLNSKFSTNPIDNISQFQNINDINLKNKSETKMFKQDILDMKESNITRRHSAPEKLKVDSNSESMENKTLEQEHDEIDSVLNLTLRNTLENLKQSTLIIIFAFGNGYFQFNKYKDCTHTYPEMFEPTFDGQTLFTFLD